MENLIILLIGFFLACLVFSIGCLFHYLYTSYKENKYHIEQQDKVLSFEKLGK